MYPKEWNRSTLAVGALKDNAPNDNIPNDPTPIGIATAQAIPNKIAELTSLGVASTADFNLIGKQLLDALAREAAPNIRMLTALYPAHTAKTDSLDQLLRDCRWEGPELVIITCRFVSHQFSPPWYLKPYKLPQGFSFFPWSELTPQEELSIRSRWERGVVIPDVYPYYEKTVFEPSNSLGLRHHEKVIGWCLTEPKSPQTLWYSKLYVDPPYRTSGLGIQLLSASIRKHDHVRYPNVLFKLNLVQSSLRWLRFVRRRLIPYANSVQEYIQMWKELS